MSNREYQAKFKQTLVEKGYKFRSIGLKQESIDKINALKKEKGISFNEALDLIINGS